MTEENEFASPVFKKRFARRKTTHRPFTFARNFEAAGSSTAQNQIIKQVGDRGVVITSPVQLPKDNEGLSITDIVRQSPVPVLIAHATPKDSQKKVPNQEDEQQDSSHRRSGRRREPSDRFLNRQQYPFSTPNKLKLHRTPDDHYIGSQNDSNIDEEVSVIGDEEHTKSKRKAAASSSRSRKTKKAGTTQHSSTLEASIASSRDASQIHDSDIASSAKQPSTRKVSRKTAGTSSKTKSKGKEKKQPVRDRTPSPPPVKNSHSKSQSNRVKRSVPAEKKESQSAVKKSDNLAISENSRSGRNRSSRNASTVSSASGVKNKSASISNAFSTSSQKENNSSALEAVAPDSSAGTASAKNRGKGTKRSTVHEEVNGNLSQGSVRGKTRTTGRPVLSATAEHNERVAASTVKGSEASGSSSEKRKRQDISGGTRVASAQRASKKKEQALTTSTSQLTKRAEKPAQAQNSSKNGSILGKRRRPVDETADTSPLKSRKVQESQKPYESPRRFFSDPERSPQKLVANKIVGVKTSWKRGLSKASNSFWKTSRRMSSDPRPQGQRMNVSVSSVYDDETFGGEESDSSTEIDVKGRAHHQHRQDSVLAGNKNKKKSSKVTTELDVIMDMLDETETQVLRNSRLSKSCQSYVHMAFTFTRKQLQETLTQVTEIKELMSQANKLKTQCKAMSNESKENHQQKCIIQRELKTLQGHGVDGDMVLIDQWLQDFQALRQSHT